MTRKSRRPARSLTTRLIFARHELARHAWFRRHEHDAPGGVRQPSKFSLLMTVALIAIVVVAAISVFQLLDAAIN